MGENSFDQIEQIKAVNHHLRLAVDQIEEGVAIVEATPFAEQGPAVIFANAAILKIIGLPKAELVGQRFSKIYPGEQLGALFSHLAAAVESRAILPIDSGIRLSDGATKPCHWTARPVLNPEGKPLSIILTARPEHDAATLASPSAPTGRLSESAAGGGSEDSDREPNSTASPTPTPPPLPSQRTKLEEVDRGGPNGEDKPDQKDKTGKEAVSSTSEAVSSAAKKPRVPGAAAPKFALPPIDEYLDRNRLESLAMLAGGIAHDFRNSLTAIIANLSLAKPLTEPGTELYQHLEDVEIAAEGARELTCHLLAFAKGSKPRREPSDVSRLVKESIQLATYGASVKCRITMDDDLWQSEVDPTQIKQVLNNLIINAWQAMPGGGTIRVTAENVQVTDATNVDVRPGHYVALGVIDRGCGIAEDNLKKIFDPFFTTKSTGSGIGLATCYRVIKQHEGDIVVRSKEHVGTEFKVFIPACRTTTLRKKVSPNGNGKGDGLIRGSGNILVVDDQKSIRSVASMILKKLGYTVSAAADGESAVKMYDSERKANRPFAAVLMDMTLPGGMNGEETFYEIRRNDPQVRVIASSGFFDHDAKTSYRDLGFTDILPKPYSASVLSKILHETIHGAIH